MLGFRVYPLLHSLTNTMDKKQKIKKVIQIIWNIVSIIFVTFISGALIINAIKGADEKTQDIVTPNIQEEYKAKRNYGYTDEYGIQLYMYVGDFLDSGNILRFIDEYSNQVSSSFSYNNYTTYSMWLTTNGQIYILGPGASVENGRVLYQTLSISWTKANGATGITDFVENVYTLSIYTSNTLVFKVEYYVSVPAHSSNGMDLGAQIIRTNLVRTIDNWWCYRENNMDSNNTPFITYLMYPQLNNQTDYANQNYNRGYNTGYNAGIQYAEAQYNAGYDRGYIAGAEGVESNAFTVIGQAFSSVANMFNIEVLPGLPLWILVFTPLIITIVIVVIKMIKG